MAKVLKRVLIVALLVCAVAVFAACQDFTWGPVMGTDSDAVVTGNGSLAVRQGEYLYFINGNDDTSTLTAPEDNYFGQASVKGSIMKSRIAEDGSLTDTRWSCPRCSRRPIPTAAYTSSATGYITLPPRPGPTATESFRSIFSNITVQGPTVPKRR